MIEAIFSYPCTLFENGLNRPLDDYARAVAAMFEGTAIGSGAGCGYRDLEFKFPSEEGAIATQNMLPKFMEMHLTTLE